MKTKLAAILVIAVILVSGCAIKPNTPTPTPKTDQPLVELKDLKKFSSMDEIKNFIKNNTIGYYGHEGFGVKGSVMPLAATTSVIEGAVADSSKSAGSVPDYSKTNIQVEGVDEPDIVKTDGKYIYAVSGNKNIGIVEAYPAENGKLLSTIEINGTVEEIFVNKDRLVVFGRENKYSEPPTPITSEVPVASGLIERKASEPVLSSEAVTKTIVSRPSIGIAREMSIAPYYYSQKQFVRVYDLTDRKSPVLKKNIELEGVYFDSRMIGNWIYFIVNNRVYGDEIILPLKNQPEVGYIDVPSDSYMFTLVGALNVGKDEPELASKTFLLPSTQSMFVSMDNIYITHQIFPTPQEVLDGVYKEAFLPNVPDIAKANLEIVYNSNASAYQKINEMDDVFNPSLYPGIDFEQQKELREAITKIEEKVKEVREILERPKTIVYKISVKGNEIALTAKGDVPGRILNQFSMDEFNGNFRIATTTGNTWDQSSRNHVYVLDNELKTIGKLEDLAPGESIYSARFIGERVYLVTFKKIDPLFVIDLKDPTNPKILGKLKIPGFSDYLHPYDQNHIIGIGKEAVEAEQGDFAWYQGVKLALFDVSDPENPKELSKYTIGDRGTDSYALKDHKAFLFNKEKNLLVIPVLLAELDKEIKEETFEDFKGSRYGEYTFQGAYVFELTKEKGFVLKGRITHVSDEDAFKKSGYYYYGSGDSVKRSLYIGDVLYTISDKLIKANNLQDLSEIKSIELPYKEGDRIQEKLLGKGS